MVKASLPQKFELTGINPLMAKRTARNQITISDAVFDAFPDQKCFEVSVEYGRIVLTPVESADIGEVWKGIADLGITKSDVSDAIDWARGR